MTENGAFKVRIASTGVTIDVSVNDTVVDTLLTHGIAVETSCEQGVCGSCLTRVLEGEPDHRDSFMTPAEHARNDQMTLCCSRSRSALLVLDL